MEFVGVRRELGLEWFADALVHATGFGAGLLAAVVLIVVAIRRARSPHHASMRSTILLALGLYGLGLVAMLTCSALYNLYVDHPYRLLLRRFDHAAIFVMIAGTFTPFALLCVRGVRGWKMFAGIWAMAAVGIILKFTVPAQFEILSIPAYLALGWTIIFAYRPLREALPHPGLPLLAAGCALYSVGAAFYMWSELHYQLAIWHICVLLAATCHFACIIGYASGPTALARACRDRAR